MSTPFRPYGMPFVGGPPEGFGLGPQGHSTVHEKRRSARSEVRGNLRSHGRGHDNPGGAKFGAGLGRGFKPGGFGPGGFGPGGAGPGGFGFGFGFGPGTRGGRRGGPGRRGRRGDVRAAILVLLAERPMHGYEMIQEIAERSQDLWRPSPGSVYPTLQLLVDEGLCVGSEIEGTKKLFELTEDGRAAAKKITTPPWEEIADGVDPSHLNLQTAVGQLLASIAQAAHAATREQQQRIIDVVNNARREIYTVLSEDE